MALSKHEMPLLESIVPALPPCSLVASWHFPLQGTASSRPAGNMTIIHKADKRKGAAPAKAAAPEIDRTVANCLCCGKVYDCRESSSNDVKLFIGEQSATMCPH